MLKLGENGAIPQRDKTTYAIAPHIPCGVSGPVQETPFVPSPNRIPRGLA